MLPLDGKPMGDMCAKGMLKNTLVVFGIYNSARLNDIRSTRNVRPIGGLVLRKKT